jgi:hypothetical protein
MKNNELLTDIFWALTIILFLIASFYGMIQALERHSERQIISCEKYIKIKN